MLHATRRGTETDDSTALVLMHFLGGSAREWDEVVALLGPQYSTVTVDLPGFGDSADVPGYSVAQMADAVEALVAHLHLRRFVLVGHSMSGKVAAVVARRFEDRAAAGALPTARLEGLVLVAPSPPGPEPMTEDKRASMLQSLGPQSPVQESPVQESPDQDAQQPEDAAYTYITKSEEREIPPAVVERAVRELLRMNRAAWKAWIESGSREDWSQRVGVLTLPVLVVAGELDRSLGPEQQRQATLPHLRHGELRIVPDCSHLVPMERPEELAALLREFIARLRGPGIPAAYAALIASDRVSPKTRQLLEQRLAPPPATDALTPTQKETLHALCARIVPQQPGQEIDLAGSIAARLASGTGDGWRFDVLPGDLEAYRQALDALAGFAGMTEDAQDQALRALGAELGSPAMRWFQELRGDAAVVYMAHPATYARVGYSGIGVGGPHTPAQGFVAISIGAVEDWEPEAQAPEAQAGKPENQAPEPRA